MPMTTTSIEWVRDPVTGKPGKSWNPTTGCDKVSDGCKNCYAETIAHRFAGSPAFPHGFEPRMRPDRLDAPLRTRGAHRVFVNSDSDLFHDAFSDEYIARVFAVMAAARRHTFLLLTKRHARMRSLFASMGFYEQVAAAVEAVGQRGLDRWPLPNVHLGVSVEDQRWADIRIPALLDTPAAVRWISAEPLLGPVDLTRMGPRAIENVLEPSFDQDSAHVRRGLDWVVTGGESGAGARPMHPDWARSLRDQCAAASVPFFFKQWGAWAPSGAFGLGNTDPTRSLLVGEPQGHLRNYEEIRKVGRKATGRLLDGVEHNAYPEPVR